MWDRANGSAFDVCSAAMTLLSKLRRARELDISHKHQIHTVGVGWNKPHEEWLKINVDAATF